MTAIAHPRREAAISLLADLVAFSSVSLQPNEPIVAISILPGIARCHLLERCAPDGKRFNLLARIGPDVREACFFQGILMLSPQVMVAGALILSPCDAGTGGCLVAGRSI